MDSQVGGPQSRSRCVLIVLASLCAEGTPVMAYEMCRRWKAQGIQVRVLTLLREPREMEADFTRIGVGVESIDVSGTGVGRYLKLVNGVSSVVRGCHVDAVLSMPFGWHVFVALGARLGGCRHMAVHVGNYPVSHGQHGFWKFHLEVLFGRLLTDCHICCSNYVREGIARHLSVPPAASIVVYNGVNIDDVSRRADAARRAHGEVLIVGMVARLEVHKDQDTLITAIKELATRRPTELWLIGDGSRRAHLEALVRKLRLEHVIRFLGAQREIPELLGQLDVFAFSAKPDEGLGIALIEAMAARVPIVATDVGACREVLQDGALGLLVPVGAASSMAAAIERVAAGGQEVQQRVERAFQRATRDFCTDIMAHRYAAELNLL